MVIRDAERKEPIKGRRGNPLSLSKESRQGRSRVYPTLGALALSDLSVFLLIELPINLHMNHLNVPHPLFSMDRSLGSSNL